MRCYYTYDDEGKKFHIPGCWPVVLSGDPKDCDCYKTWTFSAFEKKIYNEKLQERNQEIKRLEELIVTQNRLIKKLFKKISKQ